MEFDEAVRRLTGPDRFARPLPPGPAALMPVFSDERLRARLEPTGTARPAAVLVLLFPDANGDAHLVLTERLTYDGHHSGEVSFPGGKAEPEDGGDPAATALREAAEEIALAEGDHGVRVIGQLDEVFIPVSDYRITPVIAASGVVNPRLVPHPAEVARILTPSVDAFLPDAPIEMVERTIQGFPLRYGGYRIDGLHVWGATARILGQLGALLDAR